MMESPAVARLAAHVQAHAPGSRLAAPLVVGWLVTTNCQLDCRHCWVDRRQVEVSPAERLVIARRLAASGSCRVALSGGEVTLLPDLPDLLRELKESGTPVSVYTNALEPAGPAGRGGREGRGSWLDYWDPRVDYAQVSLDGGDRRDFEAQRGAGTFDRFLRGVEFLHRRGVRTLARYIATPFNRGNVHSAARLALDMGFEGFAAELFYPEGRAAEIDERQTVATALKFNASIAEMLGDDALMASRLKLGIVFPCVVRPPDFVREALPRSPERPSLSVAVPNGTTICFVAPSGEVLPASHLESREGYRCGSLLDRDLDDIWRSGPGFARMPRVRDLSSAPCSRCPDFRLCRGGRAERALSRFGTIHAHDPACHRCRTEANAPSRAGN